MVDIAVMEKHAQILTRDQENANQSNNMHKTCKIKKSYINYCCWGGRKNCILINRWKKCKFLYPFKNKG